MATVELKKIDGVQVFVRDWDGAFTAMIAGEEISNKDLEKLEEKIKRLTKKVYTPKNAVLLSGSSLKIGRVTSVVEDSYSRNQVRFDGSGTNADTLFLCDDPKIGAAWDALVNERKVLDGKISAEVQRLRTVLPRLKLSDIDPSRSDV